MMNQRFTWLLLMLLWLPSALLAQTIELEKATEISRKSKKGVISEANYYPDANEYELIYVTGDKETWKKKIFKWEAYIFDANTFELKKQEEGEEVFDKNNKKQRERFKKFHSKFRGEDEYTVEALGVEGNLVGTLVLRHKIIKYDWSWLWDEYDVDVTIKDKLKPKNDEGAKFKYLSHIEEDSTGNALILVASKNAGSGLGSLVSSGTEFHVFRYNLALDLLGDAVIKFDEPNTLFYYQPLVYGKEGFSDSWLAAGYDLIFMNAAQTKYTVVKVNGDCKVQSRTSFDFQYPQQVIFNGKSYVEVGKDGSRVTGMDMVFAPMATMGKNSVKDPNPRNFSVVRVDIEAGKVLNQESFEAPKVGLKIDGIYPSWAEDGWYIYMISSAAKELYQNNTILNVKKIDKGHILKISEGKFKYFSSFSLGKDLISKLKTSPVDKKAPKYPFKGAVEENASLITDQNLLVARQIYTVNPKTKARKYSHPFAYHFDQQGNLKSLYAINFVSGETKDRGATQAILPFGDKAMWVLYENEGVRTGSNKKVKLLMYPRVGGINIATGNIDKMITFGLEGKNPTYFLDNNFPTLPYKDDTKIVFFGADKKGGKIWFGRLGN